MEKQRTKKIVVWRDIDIDHPEKEFHLKFFEDGTMKAEFVYPREDEDAIFEYDANKTLCVLFSNEVVNLLFTELANAKEEGLF